MGDWHRASDPPKKPGVYIVAILTREWCHDTIEEGSKPAHDKYWNDHSNLYGQLPDGRWIEETVRVWNGKNWSGFQETLLFWTNLPVLPFSADEPPLPEPGILTMKQQFRCLNCYISMKYLGKTSCLPENEIFMKQHPSERPNWCPFGPKV